MDELLKYAMGQGPWALMAIVGLYGAWRGCHWLGIVVIQPMANRHISFVDGVANTLTEISTTLRSTRDELSSLRSNHEEHVDRCPNSAESTR